MSLEFEKHINDVTLDNSLRLFIKFYHFVFWYNLFCEQCKVMLAKENKKEVFNYWILLKIEVNEERNIKRTLKIVCMCVWFLVHSLDSSMLNQNLHLWTLSLYPAPILLSYKSNSLSCTFISCIKDCKTNSIFSDQPQWVPKAS